MGKQVELSEKQLDRILACLAPKPFLGPNPYVQILIVPLAIALVGAFVTWRYNVQQAEINRTQTMEKFVVYFGRQYSMEQKIAALTTMVELGYQNQAADFLVLAFGTKSSLERVDIEPFVMAKGLKLLPRLCELSIVGRNSSIASIASDFGLKVITRVVITGQHGETQAAAFMLLEELALSRNADPEVRQGALYMLELTLSGAKEPSLSDQQDLTASFRNWPGLEQKLKNFVLSNASEPERATALRCIWYLQHDNDAFFQRVIEDRGAGEQPRVAALFQLLMSNRKSSRFESLLKMIVLDRSAPEQLRDAAANMKADPTNAEIFKGWLLNGGTRDDQLVAAAGLRKLPENTSVPIFLQAYSKVADFEVKRRILVNLTLFPDSAEVVGWLTKLVRSELDPALRADAYAALIQIHRQDDHRDIDALLLDGMKDTDSRVLETILRFSAMDGTPQLNKIAREQIEKLDDPELKVRLKFMLQRFHKDNEPDAPPKVPVK